jgi:hypothetical protein
VNIFLPISSTQFSLICQTRYLTFASFICKIFHSFNVEIYILIQNPKFLVTSSKKEPHINFLSWVFILPFIALITIMKISRWQIIDRYMTKEESMAK